MNKEDWRLEDASFESNSRQELLRGYVSRNQVDPAASGLHAFPPTFLANSYSSCKGDLDLCFGNDPGPSPLLLLLPTPSCAPSSSTAPCIYILVTLSSGFCSGLSNTLSGVTGFTSMRPERHVATRCWYQLHRAERCTGSSSMNELGSSRGIPVVRW